MNNLHRCVSCNKTLPETQFGRLKGKLRTVCKPCRSEKERLRQQVFYPHITEYHSRQSFLSTNYSRLLNLKTGNFKLYSRHSDQPIGWISNRVGSVYVKLFDREFLMECDYLGLATILANRNVYVSSEPIELPEGSFILSHVKKLHEIISPADRQIYLNSFSKMLQRI